MQSVLRENETLDKLLLKLFVENKKLIERVSVLDEENKTLRELLGERRDESDTESEYEPESDTESDSDYESESDTRPAVRGRSLLDTVRELSEAGNKAQKFVGLLRKSVTFPDKKINQAYDSVLNVRVYSTGPALKKSDIKPNFWVALGSTEAEKLNNAKKVLEFLYTRR